MLICVWLFATSRTVAHQAPLSMEFSKQNTEVGCCSLLQGIFLTQRSNLGLLHCRQTLYCLVRGAVNKQSIEFAIAVNEPKWVYNFKYSTFIFFRLTSSLNLVKIKSLMRDWREAQKHLSNSSLLQVISLKGSICMHHCRTLLFFWF